MSAKVFQTVAMSAVFGLWPEQFCIDSDSEISHGSLRGIWKLRLRRTGSKVANLVNKGAALEGTAAAILVRCRTQARVVGSPCN